MKGVILAGGTAKRLRPLTYVTNKHLLPVYKKPMIYYSIEVMINHGINDIMIVTGGEHIGHFFRLLGSGKKWNCKICYEVQEESNGTGAALLLAEDFVKDDDCLVYLGDNILIGSITNFINDFKKERDKFKAKILLTEVKDPENFGVVHLDGNKITKIIEKPKNPKSNLVATGIWIFTPDIFTHLKAIKQSKRGEYEIIDVFNYYAKNNQLTYSKIGQKIYWSDAGTFQQLFDATILMKRLEDEKLIKISSDNNEDCFN